jgi:hypothetical protein
MVGTANKNENSTAVFLWCLRDMAPIIVAAERDIPGIIAAAWASPIKKHAYKKRLRDAPFFLFSLYETTQKPPEQSLPKKESLQLNKYCLTNSV